MKTDKNFKFPKKYKRRLALMRCSQEIRNLWKKSYIQVVLAEEEYKRAKFAKERVE